MAPPTNLKVIKCLIKGEFMFKSGLMRISPYPPNFSKMAAKIIDPATGAST